jgi:aldose 1-epimerase
MALLQLHAGDGDVAIAPAVGGAIASFALGGVDVLRPTPAAAMAERNVRAFACYPLVPYSNRIADATLRHAGRDYPLARNFGDHPHAIHGVGWQVAWDVVAAGANSALLTHDHQATGATAQAWPFPFRATQRFALSAAGDAALLSVTLTVANTGREPFPFGLGWHPYFPKSPAATLAFRATGVWANDATQLPIGHLDIPAAWRFDAARAIDAATLDNVFTGWSGAAHIAWPERALQVALGADRACDHLVVFVPPGRDFLAIEPVTHMTDAFNRHAAGEPATGTRMLAPGAAFSCTMRLRAAPLSR